MRLKFLTCLRPPVEMMLSPQCHPLKNNKTLLFCYNDRTYRSVWDSRHNLVLFFPLFFVIYYFRRNQKKNKANSGNLCQEKCSKTSCDWLISVTSAHPKKKKIIQAPRNENTFFDYFYFLTTPKFILGVVLLNLISYKNRGEKKRNLEFDIWKSMLKHSPGITAVLSPN